MQWFACRIIYGLVRAFNTTYRYRYAGLENLQTAHQLGKNRGHLLGIWHQNLFQGILAQNGKHYVVIVSRSRDAEPVAYTCSSLGHAVVRGSSKTEGVDKGGKLAKDEMIELLKQGVPGAVTVDGPKGPARVVKAGIIDMARKSGTPLVPYLVIPERYWSFASWDRFRLPKPFSRIIAYYGEPIVVDDGPDSPSFEAAQRRLKAALDDEEAEVVALFSQWNELSPRNDWH